MFVIRGELIIALISFLEHMERQVIELRAGGSWESARNNVLSDSDRQAAKDDRPSVLAVLDQLGCPMTSVAYRRLSDRIAENELSLEDYYNKMTGILERFTDEMGAKPIFMASQDAAAFWAKDDHVSQAVKDRFSEVAQELRAAGSALCSSLFTASVFHSMRAAEMGLRAVAGELEVSLKGDESMKNLVDLIRSKASFFADGPKCPDKRQRSQKYSELAIEAGLFKDAWRNHVSHGRATYDETQAREILRATCRLFERLVAPISDV